MSLGAKLGTLFRSAVIRLPTWLTYWGLKTDDPCAGVPWVDSQRRKMLGLSTNAIVEFCFSRFYVGFHRLSGFIYLLAASKNSWRYVDSPPLCGALVSSRLGQLGQWVQRREFHFLELFGHHSMIVEWAPILERMFSRLTRWPCDLEFCGPMRRGLSLHGIQWIWSLCRIGFTKTQLLLLPPKTRLDSCVVCPLVGTWLAIFHGLRTEE